MSPPEPGNPVSSSEPLSALAGAPISIRDRLKRLGAAGIKSQRPAQSADVLPRAADVHPQVDSIEVLRARYGPGHRHGRHVLGETLGFLARHREALDLERTVWLDTETTGLAGGTGTCAFLIGAAFLERGTLVVEQLLLRRLSAEGRLLGALRDRLGPARHLVTFNGQRFDWPILEARFILARQQPAAVETHTDLIYPARRLWHRVLGTHRLSALEAEILGAPRTDDVPGWEIPMIYIQYLRTSNRSMLEPVLAHNRADLLALVLLHGEVARILSNPATAGGPLDWEGAGVLLGRRGDHRQAVACFARAVQEASEPRGRWRVLQRLARQYRILGNTASVEALWEEEAQTWVHQDRYHAHVLEEVAKERRRRGDPDGERAAAEQALDIALSLCAASSRIEGPLVRLVDRLRRRLSRPKKESPAG